MGYPHFVPQQMTSRTKNSKSPEQVKESPEPTIRSRIAEQGKITFAEFMELALYHPEGGYYTSPSPFGATGDYYTSPAAHPAFGALMAIQLRRMWEALDSPARFFVVEMGAGSGLLARDVVDYASKMSGYFSRCLRYIAQERYAAIGGKSATVIDIRRIVADGVPLRGVVGCFISNELVDSFPVHRFQVHQGTPKEVYVALDEHGEFAEVLDEPSSPLLAERLGDAGRTLPEGFRGEVNLRVRPWMREISAALERGFVVTIDYGYGALEQYASKRSEGTIQTYYRHTQGGSLYQRIGRQDITSHVDFSSIASEGWSLGLISLGLLTQSHFLRGLGFQRMLERLREHKLSQRERNANRMATLELAKPDGLGNLKVLIQERATGIKDLSQLLPDTSSMDETEVPLLRPDHIPLMEGRYPHLAFEPEEMWPFGGRRQ